MGETGTSRLRTSGRTAPGTVPRWAAEEQQRIHETLLATLPSPYPCHFGAIGESRGTNHYTYWDLNADFRSEAKAVARDLEDFIAIQRDLPDERMSLLLMVGPPDPGRVFAWYRTMFWRILSALHTYDRAPQPPDVPDDPEDPLWEFTFGGETLFTFGTCPAYGPRRSRTLGECLVIGMQSRTVFRSISGSTPAGRAAKKRIRRSLAAYEDVPLLADSGDGTGSTTHKWKQYFPDVDGRSLTGTCPVRWEKR
jgi:FPC/CPF motif-containing protein YcgG